jgi:hypothetical protein
LGIPAGLAVCESGACALEYRSLRAFEGARPTSAVFVDEFDDAAGQDLLDERKRRNAPLVFSVTQIHVAANPLRGRLGYDRVAIRVQPLVRFMDRFEPTRID